MPDNPIKGLLFDKDGTLFDFSASWSAVVSHTIRELARSDAEADAMATDVGFDRRNNLFLPGSIIVAGAVRESAEIWASYRPDLGVTFIEDLANRVADQAVAEGALVPAVPDFKPFLCGLKESGYVLGIATHDSESAARTQVARYNALECFAFIAGYDSGYGLKPGPGMMLAFCKATALVPSECAMIGDSIHDLGVAGASGAALAIGVLTGPAGHDDISDHADHVLGSIAELPALLETV